MNVCHRNDRRAARRGRAAAIALGLCALGATSGACRGPDASAEPAVVPDPIDESLTDAERERNERFEDLRRKRYKGPSARDRGTPVEARAPR